MAIATTSPIYSLNATPEPKGVLSGHLRMGTASSPTGHTITANSLYLMRNGKPFLPVMGEIHFSRCPRSQWEESLLKMKAGGVDIAATYVFWNHHEEDEGIWDWTGNKSIRTFIELCAKHDIYSYPRIGPWSHGEVRNGGFPDWLYAKCRARTTDPAYFAFVRKLYLQIFAQVNGLLFKDGGPIIGIQLDNEFMHCGGEGGDEYMMTLKHLAREIGFDVPLYTATGWGGSPIPEDEFIPVLGGYADAPWEPGHHQLPPNSQFLFEIGIPEDPLIGSDLATPRPVIEGITYRRERYPWCMAELGPGNQVAKRRRPIIYDDDAAAMSLIKLAGGANLLGYYMYRGGTNPLGKHCTLEEPGYPAINYDFQAPISEFGLTNAKYHLLRRLHLFLRDFGDSLAPMIPVLPDRQPTTPEDVDTLRFMARVKDDAGYLFISNHQRYVENKIVTGQIELTLTNETLHIPNTPFALPANAIAIWPFNLMMDGVLLKYATAQLLARTDVGDDLYYFFFAVDDIPAVFEFDASSVTSVHAAKANLQHNGNRLIATDLEPGTDCIISITAKSGRRIHICTLTSEQSLNMYKATAWGAERIFLTDSTLLLDGDRLTLTKCNSPNFSFAVFPNPDRTLHSNQSGLSKESDGIFTRYAASVAHRGASSPADWMREQSVDCNGVRTWRIAVPPNAITDPHDLFLRIDYRGDQAQLFLGGVLVADDLYYGKPWVVGLKRFAPDVVDRNMILRITPLARNAEIYMEPEAWPEFNGSPAIAELRSIEAVPEFAATFS